VTPGLFRICVPPPSTSGHTIGSSEICARADLDTKHQTLERAGTSTITFALESWQEDESLIEWLRAL
jgi:hypothetical protein